MQMNPIHSAGGGGGGSSAAAQPPRPSASSSRYGNSNGAAAPVLANSNDGRGGVVAQQHQHHDDDDDEDDDDTFSGDFFRRLQQGSNSASQSHNDNSRDAISNAATATHGHHHHHRHPNGNHHHHHNPTNGDNDDHHFRYDDFPDGDDDVDDDDLNDDDEDLNSEAREYYNSGASELVTTVRGDGYGGGGGASSSLRITESECSSSNSNSSHYNMQEEENERTGLRHRHHPSSAGGRSKYQSHNYEPDESEVWRAYVAQQHFANRGQWWTTGKLRALKRWMLTLVVGVTQAIIAVTCNLATKSLMQTKYDHVYDLMEYHRLSSSSSPSNAAAAANADNDAGYYTADGYLDADQDGIADTEEQYQYYSSGAGGGNGDTMDDVNAHLSRHYFNFGKSPYLTFLFYQTLFVLCASLFVYIEPVSGGSGIPDIKCYLNGIDVPRIVDFKTLVCRVMGVTFSVAAGLPVGKEGPMVHSGGVVAAVISQGRTKFWGVDTSFSKFSDFRNDREKRGELICLLCVCFRVLDRRTVLGVCGAGEVGRC